MRTFVLFAMMTGAATAANSVHDFTMKSIDGKDVSLADYKGKVLLMVNVASKCGYTGQYKELESLYRKFKDKGVVVMGFPANDFMWQEPGSNEEIAQFCKRTYDVSFPLFAKIGVLGGGKAQLYEYLTSDRANPKTSGMIKWNFTKFLIGPDGKPVARFGPGTNPEAPEVISEIEKALGK